MRLPEVRKILSATSAMLGHPRPCAVGAPQDVDMVSNEDIMENLLPFRHGVDLGLVLVDLVPRQFAAVCVDVDLTRAQPALALPDEAADPEGDDDGERQVRLEEALSIIETFLACGTDGGIELCRNS